VNGLLWDRRSISIGIGGTIVSEEKHPTPLEVLYQDWIRKGDDLELWTHSQNDAMRMILNFSHFWMYYPLSHQVTFQLPETPMSFTQTQTTIDSSSGAFRQVFQRCNLEQDHKPITKSDYKSVVEALDYSRRFWTINHCRAVEILGVYESIREEKNIRVRIKDEYEDAYSLTSYITGLEDQRKRIDKHFSAAFNLPLRETDLQITEREENFRVRYDVDVYRELCGMEYNFLTNEAAILAVDPSWEIPGHDFTFDECIRVTSGIRTLASSIENALYANSEQINIELAQRHECPHARKVKVALSTVPRLHKTALSEKIRALTDCDIPLINQVIDYFLFNHYEPINRADVNYTPLFQDMDNRIYLSPLFIKSSRVTRNILKRLIMEESYDDVRDKRYRKFEQDVAMKLNPIITTRRIEIRDITDIDVFGYSDNEIIICQCKSSISPDSGVEVYYADLDIRDALDQLKKVEKYITTNLQELLDRNQITISNIDALNIFYLVVVPEHLGSIIHERKYPISTIAFIDEVISSGIQSISELIELIKSNEPPKRVKLDDTETSLNFGDITLTMPGVSENIEYPNQSEMPWLS